MNYKDVTKTECLELSGEAGNARTLLFLEHGRLGDDFEKSMKL